MIQDKRLFSAFIFQYQTYISIYEAEAYGCLSRCLSAFPHIICLLASLDVDFTKCSVMTPTAWNILGAESRYSWGGLRRRNVYVCCRCADRLTCGNNQVWQVWHDDPSWEGMVYCFSPLTMGEASAVTESGRGVCLGTHG